MPLPTNDRLEPTDDTYLGTSTMRVGMP